MQCTFDAAVLDTYTFINLYSINDSNTVRDSDAKNSSEGVSLFMVGGGCPKKTEVIAKVIKFLFLLEV